MKAAKYLGIAAAAAVGISSSLAFAASNPIASPVVRSIGARRLAALSQASRTKSKDPLITGTNSQTIPPGLTEFFFAESSELAITGCSAVDIKHADGGIFDPNNTGKLVVHGMDVSVLFLDSDGDDLTQSLFLGAVSPNNSLFAGGYAVTSPQSVEVLINDLPLDSDNVAVIVEGDVTNTDTKPQTVDSLVDGIIKLEGCI